jgi:hypothetical protein
LPNRNEHVEKAHGNEEFAGSLVPADPTKIHPVDADWAIVAYFYAALHYVEAYFATQGADNFDHETRDDSIRNDAQIKQIFRPYSKLKSYGHNARYYIQTFNETDVNYARSHLDAIKAHLTTLISLN